MKFKKKTYEEKKITKDTVMEVQTKVYRGKKVEIRKLLKWRRQFTEAQSINHRPKIKDLKLLRHDLKNVGSMTLQEKLAQDKVGSYIYTRS